MNNVKNRNQIFAFRTTKDFTKKFDELCDRLGYCRSEVVRYALKQFVLSNWNNTDSFNKVKQVDFPDFGRHLMMAKAERMVFLTNFNKLTFKKA